MHEEPVRQRVQKRFNGVPCEIFINNPTQVRQYFASELQQNRPVTAHMLATGQIVHGQANSQLLALQEEARHYATLASPLTEEQTTFRKYHIVTLLEDAADTLATDEASSCYILDQTIAQVVEFVFAAHQRPLPRIKERLAMLCEVDATIGQSVRQYYQQASIIRKHELANALILHVTGNVEFFEWSSALA